MHKDCSFNLDCNKTWENGEIKASLSDNWFASLIVSSLLWALHYELIGRPEKWVVKELSEAEKTLSHAQFNGLLV